MFPDTFVAGAALQHVKRRSRQPGSRVAELEASAKLRLTLVRAKTARAGSGFP
mgnify:CR=1 FL=1